MRSGAWTRKEGQDPAGGLNARGRAAYKAATGGTLRPPVKSGDDPRRASFLARMGANPGPEYRDGQPTRLLLSLRRWGATSKADAKKKASAIYSRIRGDNTMKKTRRNPARKNLARGLGITQRDLNDAAGGLRMLYMTPSELTDLAKEFEDKNTFMAQAIVLAARQMAASKRRMGASENPIGKRSSKQPELDLFMSTQRNPARKNLTRPSQATGRKPGARLLRRRKRTIGAPRGFFANPAQSMYKVLARAKPSAPFALIGSFKDKARAMQYARAVHKASPTSLSVKVTT